MGFDVQMIGTGSAFAKKYFNNNALIRAAQFQLLVDCGITAPVALHQLSVDVAELDAILITHIHGDHVGGLEEVGFRMRYIYRRKPVLYVPDTIVNDLWNGTLRGAMENAAEGCDSLSCYFDVQLIREKEPFEVTDGLSIELVPTKHIPGKPSYGLLINETLFYSSDVTFDPQLLLGLVRGSRCRHIMHDCQLKGKGQVHTTLEELLTLPLDIQERILLMHYDDDMECFIGSTGPMKFVEQHRVYSFG